MLPANYPLGVQPIVEKIGAGFYQLEWLTAFFCIAFDGPYPVSQKQTYGAGKKIHSLFEIKGPTLTVQVWNMKLHSHFNNVSEGVIDGGAIVFDS